MARRDALPTRSNAYEFRERVARMAQRLAGVFRKPRRDAEFAAELESHLQMHIEDNLRAGMTPDAARRNALMKLGGVEQTKEIYRHQRGMPALETLFQNLRFGSRMLLKNPGSTGAVVIALALGIRGKHGNVHRRALGPSKTAYV